MRCCVKFILSMLVAIDEPCPSILVIAAFGNFFHATIHAIKPSKHPIFLQINAFSREREVERKSPVTPLVTGL